MSDQELLPKTARDALVVELLSDVGRLHDDIKAIPKVLQLSMADSLNIVANAVEDAEKTALSLQESTNNAIRATTAKAAFDAGAELSTAIHQTLERIFEPALVRASAEIQSLESRISKISGSVRDKHATRFNYIILAGFVISALSMIGALSWLAIVAQDANETNKWFYNEYKAQRGIIDSLPPDIKKRFISGKE
jgi:hypothetical protein